MSDCFTKLKIFGMGNSKETGTTYKYQSEFNNFQYHDNNGLFIAYPDKIEDSVCKGDSGSGVFDIDENGEKHLVGLASATSKDCGEKYQAFYIVSLLDQLNWIEESLKSIE